MTDARGRIILSAPLGRRCSDTICDGAAANENRTAPGRRTNRADRL